MRYFALVVLFAGCITSPNDPTVIALNKQRLSGNGEVVGDLPDGRVVTRYEIDRGTDPSHFIYVIADQPTVTINHSERHGKTTVNRTSVIIDGVRYTPETAPVPPEQP